MTNGAENGTQERLALRVRLMEMRNALSEAASNLRRDRSITPDEREGGIRKINRSRRKISFELGRLNEEAIIARDNDPEVRQLLQDLDRASDDLAAARERMQRATARAREAVELIGKVDRVLQVFGNIALRFV